MPDKPLAITRAHIRSRSIISECEGFEVKTLHKTTLNALNARHA